MKLSEIARHPVAAPRDDAPVTMLELFFDLVFVFVVTQVTELIRAAGGWAGYGRALLVLSLTWYIYNGFSWLTNNVVPTTLGTRLPMLAAMACFLAMAVVTPAAFGDGAWVFAVAYVAVVVIHAVQFARSPLGTSREAILGVLPVNVAIAALVTAAAVVGTAWGWVAWCAAFALILAAAAFRRGTPFALRARHFAERHHLLVIIALGETVIRVGQGSATEDMTPGSVAAFGVGLTLIIAMWWVYFGTGDDERGSHAFAGTPDEQRSVLGARAYSATHFLHIAGLVLCAVGLSAAVQEPMEPLGVALGTTSAAGVALFLLGHAGYRAALDIGSARPHVLAGGLALACAALSTVVPAVALLGALTLVLLGLSWSVSR